MGPSKNGEKPTVWTLREMYKRFSESMLSGVPLEMSFTDGAANIECVYPLSK